MSQNAQAGSSPLLTAPIGPLLRKIGTPVSVGAFFHTMFNVVDTIYGGQISDEALAALSLSFPIFFIIIALGFGFSQGATALIGNSLGRGDQKLAEKYGVQGIVFGAILSLITTALVIWSSPTLLTVMGASSPELQSLALAYINPIFYGCFFFILAQMLIGILNALGITIPGRNVLAAGFFLNLLLNPWFINGGFGLPAMGITGIALATVLVQFLSCIYLAIKVGQTELMSWRILRENLLPNMTLIGNIAQQGFPNMVDTMGVSLGFFVLNVYVGRFGSNALAALGSASRIEQLFLLPLLGLNVAVLALVARNNGAGQYGRVREIYRLSIVYGIIIMLITTVLAVTLARPIMQLFTDDPEIIATGANYARIRAIGLIPNAVFFMGSSALRGIERPLPPLILNFVRFVGLPWLFMAIAVDGFGYGLTSIWVTSTAAFFIAATIIYVYTYRVLPSPEPPDGSPTNT